MRKRLCIIFMALIVVSCISPNFSDKVVIHQTESDYPVVIKLCEERRVWAIFFPLAFKVSKRTLSKVHFSNPSYLRFNMLGEWIPTTSLLFFHKDSDLIRPKDNDKSRLLQFREREWVVYARYSNLSKERNVQTFFASDIKRAEQEHKDTLHVGSIQQLKQTNPGFLNNLLQRDSIEFSFYYKDNFHSIKLPIEIK